MNYYVIGPNGERYGPATVDDLNAWVKEGRVNASSTVEDSSTGNRIPIGTVPGIMLQAAPVPPASMPPVGSSEGGGYQYAPGYQRAVSVDNHLVKSILVTLFCCMPFGIAAIVYAAQVDSMARTGDRFGAETASNKANTWANWGLGCGLVGYGLYGILVAISIASGGFK